MPNNQPLEKVFTHQELQHQIKKHKALSHAATELGVSIGGLSSYVRKFNLGHLRTYGANIITTPKTDAEWGYLCGLLATDGNLHSKRKLITVSLQKQDKATVEWVASMLSTNKTIKQTKNEQWIFYGFNEPVYDYCMSMGITPAKSLTLNPNFVGKSEEFMWYFLRGAIDGDGWVSVISRKNSLKPKGIIGLCSGSISFILSIQTIFGGKVYTNKRKNSMYYLHFAGTMAQTLATYLPKEGFTMERKTKKMIEILELGILKKRRASSILTGSMWQNKEKYSQPEFWRNRYRGITAPIVSEEQVRSRLKRGWNFEDAISIPPQQAERDLNGRFMSTKQKA